MSRDKLRVIEDELIELFINYQFRLDHPMPTDPERAVLMYRSDLIFHSKVKHLVAGVMNVVSENIG